MLLLAGIERQASNLSVKPNELFGDGSGNVGNFFDNYTEIP